jgi:glycosyltransferase involved in cell wall biosynthesis
VLQRSEKPFSEPVPEVSVVLCTWNRADLLGGALDALVRQRSSTVHEIVDVDNNSTDATAAIVRRYAERHPQVRYVYEAAPGLSHARNAGVAATRGPIVAFTDDDVRVPEEWVSTIAAVSQRYPDAGCFGGPVLPQWTGPVPRWLTEEQWSALGVQNHSQEPFRADEARPVCLIGANLVIRRRVLEEVGPFDPAVQRVGNGIGSTEDHEYHRRIWAAGHYGIYDPSLRVGAVVTGDRLVKRYHRKWHFGHGRHIARMRLPDMERSRVRLLGVPIHLLRQAAVDLQQGVAGLARRDEVCAFDRELRLWFAAGFIRERLARSGASQ